VMNASSGEPSMSEKDDKHGWDRLRDRIGDILLFCFYMFPFVLVFTIGAIAGQLITGERTIFNAVFGAIAVVLFIEVLERS